MGTAEIEPVSFADAYADFTAGKRSISFTGNDLTLSIARQMIRNELGDKLGGKFWVGPDLASTTEVILKPESLTYVPVSLPKTFPPLTDFYHFHPYIFSCIYASTRSRYAQLGLEVSKATGPEIAATLQPAQDSPKDYNALVAVVNQGARAIHLSKGEKFFYMYWWDGSTVTGQELVDLVGSAIKVQGEQGKDWQWWRGSSKIIEGIELLIDPQSRSWIPPDPEPIRIFDGSTVNHSRDRVDVYLKKPVPRTEKPLFWIGETRAEITLDPSVHGLVDMSVACGMGIDIDEGSRDSQTNSVLIQGGNTAGRLRTEICSPTTENEIPRAILLRFAMAR